MIIHTTSLNLKGIKIKPGIILKEDIKKSRRKNKIVSWGGGGVAIHLVLIQMMSNLSLNIEISPQMCYNTLKNEQNLSLFDRGRGALSVGR